MARIAKKEKALTPEEKLAQALVPDVEKPYRLPENWCWVYINAGFNVTSSKRVHKSDWLAEGIPFYRTRELVKLSEYGYVNNDLFISQKLYDEFKKEYGVPHIDDLLISGVGTIGIPYIVKDEKPFYFKDGNIIWFQNKGIFLAKFVYYLYKSTFIINQIHDMSAGTTVDTYTIINATKTVLPLPPLTEQQRIVDRIDSLFAKLDEAKEKAQAVVDVFEDRRAAILHKAFTGELTEEWRKTNRVERDSWRQKSVDSICHSLKYGTAKKSEATGPVVVIRMGNLQQGEIDWTDLSFTTDEDDIEKYRLEPNDVLFNRTNSAALVGKTSIYRGEYPAIYAGYLIKLDYDHTVITGDYLNFALNTQDAKEYCNTVKTDGVNQSNINAKKIGAYKFPVPSKVEQEKIVEILKELLEKEKQAKEAAEQVIDQIDAMKKSILARAFRGELGTNDPADESAVELLKRVLRVDTLSPQKAKPTTIPKELSKLLRNDLEKKIIKLFFQKQTDALPIKDIMRVSSKTFDVLDCLRCLQERQIISKQENGKYILMG